MTPKRKPWEKMTADEKLDSLKNQMETTRRDVATLASAVQQLGNRVLKIERHLGLVIHR